MTARYVEVQSLHIYPIKSCGGIDITEMPFAEHGPVHDREFVVVSEVSEFITQRTHPKLCLVRCAINGTNLYVMTDDEHALIIDLSRSIGTWRQFRIWGDLCMGVDQGAEAAQFFSELLGEPCRLVRYAPNRKRYRNSDALGQKISVSYADGYPLLVVSAESLMFLNEKLETPIPMNRFRPNIVISGCAPHEEDRFTSIGKEGLRLTFAKQCVRCIIPATNQETGERGEEPTRTLATYRKNMALRGLTFGGNYVFDGVSSLFVGDQLSVR